MPARPSTRARSTSLALTRGARRRDARAPTLLLAICALALACDKQEEPPAPSPQERFATLLTAKRPALPKPLAGLRMGLELPAARTAAPALFGDGRERASDGVTVVSGALAEQGVTARALFTGRAPGFLARVELVAPRELDARALASEAWGAGAPAPGAEDVALWFNPQQGLRVSSHREPDSGGVLRFEPYVGVGELATPAAARGWNPARVLGQTLASVADAYPHYQAAGDAPGHLSLPPLQYNLERTTVTLDADESGVLRGLTIALAETGRPGAPIDVPALLDGAYPSRQRESAPETADEILMWFSPRQHLRATGRRSGLRGIATLELCSYWPLDDLLNNEESDEHPLGRPLLGASVSDIQERFPDRHKIEGEAITLTLGVSDFGPCSGQAFVRMFLEGGRVYQYELRISYTVDPTINGLVRARLDAIYKRDAPEATGDEAGDAKTGDDTKAADDKPPPPPPAVVQYSRSPRVTLRDSTALKVLSIEVKG